VTKKHIEGGGFKNSNFKVKIHSRYKIFELVKKWAETNECGEL
jgi:hypothetical protein